MIVDIVSFFNTPMPGDPDPVASRLIILFFVMAVATRWTLLSVRHWHLWAREVKREKQWLTALLITNGILLVTAAQRDDPVRVGTVILGVVFAGLASSMFFRFKNDGSTEPVYPRLYPSSILRRFR